jgi:hypothetical protein
MLFSFSLPPLAAAWTYPKRYFDGRKGPSWCFTILLQFTTGRIALSRL